MAANFHICETDIGDTCYYDPYPDAVIHYKRDNYFLLGGRNDLGGGLSGYACGSHIRTLVRPHPADRGG